MKFNNQAFFLTFFWILFLSSNILWAQGQLDQSKYQNRFLQEIERDFQQGKLSLDQKIRYQFYSLHNNKKLPPEYALQDSLPIKCGTPAVIAFHQNRNELLPSTIEEIEAMMKPQISASETYASPSGNFLIHYETSGEHAVPNQEYIEKVAAAADSSYRHEVQNLGYTDPLISGQKYDIYIRNLAGIYGETGRIGNTTFIRIENDFSENFPPNDHPNKQTGAINVTMAHELKHAIQYANSEWYGFPHDPISPHGGEWSEMDATLMEEVVYDNVNDYYNYLESNSSIFNSPGNSIPGSYFHVSWFIYFEEQFGSQFWVDIWSTIKKRYEAGNRPGMYETIITTLNQNYDSTIDHVFAESQLWHLASGPDFYTSNNGFSAPDYGFEERTEYPSPNISATINGTTDSLNNRRPVDPLAANYFQITPTGSEQNQIQITFSGDSTIYSAGAIAYFKNGRTDTFFGTSNQKLVLKTPWDWSEVESVGVTVTNFNQQANPIKLNIGVSSYNAQFATLKQNYPNPFNPTTTIEFRLLEQSNVQLKIYDVTGRIVQTIIDNNLSSGLHTKNFNGEGLASGIYIYHLVTDEKTIAKKMTLIK